MLWYCWAMNPPLNQVFWVYLNIDIVPVAWTAYRGVLMTVCNIGTKEFRPLSYWPLGLLKDHRRTRFQKELRLEEIRREFYPHQVSRMHGLYVWGDCASAIRGQKRWGIAAGTHFQPDYLMELSFTYSALSRVDTTWIDKFLLPDTIPFDESNVDWMHAYWKGVPYPGSDPLWEYIVEGRGVILGTALRNKAYEIVRQKAPLSLGQLELGRIAVELGSELYHIAPYIQRIGKTKFMVGYFADGRQENDDFMHILGRHIAKADKSAINSDAINLLKETTYRLDLGHLSSEIDSSEFVDDVERFLRAIVSEYDGTKWGVVSEPPARPDEGPIS
jgi:hypothetical protein